MPTSRFGGVPQEPLYNVTGRLNRGQAVKPAPFSAPNSGATRQWGSSQGMPDSGTSPIAQSLSNYFAPYNLYDMARMSDRTLYGQGDGKSNKGSKQGGGDYELEESSSFSDPAEASQYAADQGIYINAPVNFAEQGRFANMKDMSQQVGTGSTSQRKPLSADQKSRRNEQARARRASAKQAATATPNMPQTSGGSLNTSSDTATFNQANAQTFNVGGSVPGSGGRQYAPQSPGAPAIQIGNVVGGAVNAPAPKKPSARAPKAPTKKAGK